MLMILLINLGDVIETRSLESSADSVYRVSVFIDPGVQVKWLDRTNNYRDVQTIRADKLPTSPLSISLSPLLDYMWVSLASSRVPYICIWKKKNVMRVFLFRWSFVFLFFLD